MTRKRILIGGGVAAVAVIAVAIFLVYWFVIRDDSPPAVDLQEAVSTVEEEATPDATPTPSPAATATEAAAAATATTAPATQPETEAARVDGTWTLSEQGESFVGYRVEEELATIGYKEAVGRSPTIDATITIVGGQLTGVTVTADLRDLKSDDSRRDGAIRNQALESNQFPMATFELTEPLAVPDGLAAGEPISVEANGTLTLHGVTREVTIPIEAELANGVLVVVGSLPIVLAAYDLPPPRSPILVSIEDNGVMELQLFLILAP
ncbi:MAG: YceI family protein [Dehalococcoidia bacterium]|nr:YceI family protein [Dehalococcoidia bacterium]